MKNTMSIKMQMLALIAAIFVIVGFVSIIVNMPEKAYGSSFVGSDYSRMNLAASAAYGATTSPQVTPITGSIKTGAGSFGSVIIEGAAAGLMNFYDATTTNVAKRTGNKATSTILLASLPASLAAGTYVFDEQIYSGLLVEITGTAPTSTVTYR